MSSLLAGFYKRWFVQGRFDGMRGQGQEARWRTSRDTSPLAD